MSEHDNCPWTPERWQELGGLLQEMKALRSDVKIINTKLDALSERPDAAMTSRMQSIGGGAAGGGVIGGIIIALIEFARSKGWLSLLVVIVGAGLLTGCEYQRSTAIMADEVIVVDHESGRGIWSMAGERETTMTLAKTAEGDTTATAASNRTKNTVSALGAGLIGAAAGFVAAP